MLHRGKTNKIQKITSGEALPLILPQTLFYGDEEETNLLLSFLDRFLQSVPVYKMECTMEEEAAKTAYFLGNCETSPPILTENRRRLLSCRILGIGSENRSFLGTTNKPHGLMKLVSPML